MKCLWTLTLLGLLAAAIPLAAQQSGGNKNESYFGTVFSIRVGIIIGFGKFKDSGRVNSSLLAFLGPRLWL